MKQKKTRVARIAAILVLCSLMVWEDVHSNGPQRISSTSPPDKENALRLSFGDLRKISDDPFYVLHYRSDYRFEEYLRTGRRPALGTPNRTVFPMSSWGCTCFASLGGNKAPLLGRNFDWYDHIPLLLVTNPAEGYASLSMVDLSYFGYDRRNPPDSPVRPGNLEEVPYLPFDGMNEKGVAVGMMAIPHADPPYQSNKTTIGEIQVIRLILDYAASTDEAVGLIQKYNVRMDDPPIHYLIADSEGRAVVVEFVRGKMIVHPSTELWQVSTNFILEGSGAPDNVTCWRYHRAYAALRKEAGDLSEETAWQILRNVAQDNTIWSTVYNLKTGDVEVVVGKRFPEIHAFNLGEMTENLR